MDRTTYLSIIFEHMKKSYLLDEERIHSILPDFLTTLKNHLITLEHHAASENLPQLTKSSHTLKGALLNLGLLDLAKTAHILEKSSIQASQTGEHTDYLDLISNLREQIQIITDI